MKVESILEKHISKKCHHKFQKECFFLVFLLDFFFLWYRKLEIFYSCTNVFISSSASPVTPRCQFSTFEQCQEWSKRLSVVMRPPSRLEDLFSFAFHAWCMDVYAGEKEQHGELCRPGKPPSLTCPHVTPEWNLSPSALLLSDISAPQANTWPPGSRMRWRGWALTLKTPGGYLTSTASSGNSSFHSGYLLLCWFPRLSARR